jgi:hypothetical protein
MRQAQKLPNCSKKFQSRIFASPFVVTYGKRHSPGLTSKLPENGRMEKLGSADIFLFDGFHLERRSGLFRLDQAGRAASVALGSRAFDLLLLLVEHPGSSSQKTRSCGSSGRERWSKKAI